MELFGRTVIRTDETEITINNIQSVLNQAMIIHGKNRSEIDYLWNYYRGKQPILDRIKDIRPEICNKVVENRANEIVSFKSGYLMGEPLQYVSRSSEEDLGDEINKLNDYVFAEEKAAKDKELADWFHICGTSYRMILPDTTGEEDDSPFEIFTLDPRNAFVVYANDLSNKPMLGVKYVTDFMSNTTYSCYTQNEYFEIKNESIISHRPHVLGDIPIIEYPLNLARLGAFELVLPLLDAINNIDSNRVDGVEQFVQALMKFHNVDITAEDFENLKALGAIKYKDIDTNFKADVDYLVNDLKQSETQTLEDHLYETVLTICGMPNRQMNSTSTSDNVGSVIMRDGFFAAEGRAKNAELMFKRSERIFLKLALNICRILKGMNLKVHNIEIRFTRRNYENILQKAQVLDLMLKNNMIHPQLAFAHSGLFVDAELAYKMSMDYHEEYEQKMIEQEKELNETDANTGNDRTDRNDTESGKSGGTTDRKRASNDSRNQKEKEK